MRTDLGPASSGPGRSLRRFRVVAVLAIGVAIGVAMMATPVSGHVGTSVTHLWNAHLKAKTDARYYTKAQANARYLGSGAKAADADELDGLDSAAFLRSDGKAADAELLDGLDSTQVFRGSGRAIGVGGAIPGNNDSVVLTIEGIVRLNYSCTPAGFDGLLQIQSIEPMNLFVESGGGNPTYTALPANGFVDVPALAAGDSFHIQAQGSWGVLTIEVATVHRASDCHVQAQAVQTT